MGGAEQTVRDRQRLDDGRRLIDRTGDEGEFVGRQFAEVLGVETETAVVLHRLHSQAGIGVQ